MLKPDTVDIGEFAFAKVPVPDTTDHCPVAGAVAVLAAIVTEAVVEHTAWSGPAEAFAWALLLLTTLISSCEFPHDPLLIVHRYVFTPLLIPVTVVTGEVAFANTPVPAITVHNPEAGETAVFAAIVTEVVVEQMAWSAPAEAAGSALL